MGNVDWIQVAGFTITVVLFLGTVIGGWAYFTSEVGRVRTKESDLLARTRGEKIDDLEAEIEKMKGTIQNQQGQIDMLREFKTQEIIDGVVANGVPLVIKGVVEELRREGIG